MDPKDIAMKVFTQLSGFVLTVVLMLVAPTVAQQRDSQTNKPITILDYGSSGYKYRVLEVQAASSLNSL